MRVIFMGTPDFAVAALKAVAARHSVAAVYTQPPRPAGRGQKDRESPIHLLALQLGVPVFTPISLKDPAVQTAFAAHQADVAVVAAYGLILPRPVLAAPHLGCINIHGSLLPRWRGAAPIQRAIMAGDRESGITIMQMEAGLDTGPMLLSAPVPISDATTAGELHDTLAVLGAELIVSTLDRLAAGDLPATPQPADGVTHAAKIDKAETAIDFSKPARAVLRHIHGLSPAPGAWFAHGGERIKVLRAELAAGRGAAGTIVGDDLTVACGDGSLRLLTLQRAGKSAADGAAFLRGYALPVGTHLA
ncbi:MAG: methionyl-tRNA formyltransferase [Rhodospirillaceae bacterium]|nr:MAG: methionyl-tRNA formyltransferase [Rhodospirillaceae bacterium]